MDVMIEGRTQQRRCEMYRKKGEKESFSLGSKLTRLRGWVEESASGFNFQK